MADLPIHTLNVSHFDASLPQAARTVIEVRAKANRLRLVLGVSLLGLLAAGGLALYWWWTRGTGGFGVGFGSGKGASSIFGQGGDPSGEGGDATTPGEPGEPGDAAADGTVGDTPAADQNGNGGKPGWKNDDPGGVGDTQGDPGRGKNGAENSKGSSGSPGDGSGGSGGGSGGGVGDGQGAGPGGDDDDASIGVDQGGGEDKGEYAGGGGGTMIEIDLDPPALTPTVLAKLRTDVEDLVLGAVLDPGVDAPDLPAPLHAYDPAYGQIWWFWADVALYYNFPELPWGRLDPENETHVPWIELSVDLYRYALIIDLGENTGEEIESAVHERQQTRRPDPLRRLLWSARTPVRVRAPRHFAVNSGRTRSY